MDLKARLLGVALCDLFGTVRDGVDVYGSGGRRVRPSRYAGGRFSYSLCDNDRLLMKAAAATAASILTAADAEEVITIDRYAHLVGGARMGDRPETGVVDGDLRSFAVPNLWITDGRTLPTQGAANPALTTMALVARAADVMVGKAAPSRCSSHEVHK